MLLTELQIQLIQQLKDNPEIRASELLDKLGIKQQELTDILAGLEWLLGGQPASPDNSSVEISLAENILLDDKVIWEGMTSQAQDTFTNREIILSTDSTNNEIKHMPLGSLLLAEQQTGGRGRYGRSWLSPFASGIYLSVSLERDKFVQGTDGLSLAIGVLIANFLNKLGIGIGLKWPNDLLTSIDPVSKLGGILVELSDKQVVIGMGINYRQMQIQGGQDADLLPDKQIACVENLMSKELLESTDRSLAAGMLINHLADGLEVFCKKGFSAYQEEWNHLNILAGLELSVDTGAEIITGICRGVDEYGRLLLTDKQGKETNPISSGSIKL